MLLKNCSYIITQNEQREVLQDCDIEVKGDRISRIGRNLKGKGIDCRGKIVMPGIVNTHAHLGMHSLKGICDDEKLFDWLDIVNSQEAKLSEQQIIENTRAGAIESIKCGTTCIYDSYKFGTERIKVFESLGLRAFVSSTVTKEKHMKHVQSLLEACSGDLVKPIIAAHSPYRCSREVLEMIRDISNEHNLPKRIHIAETKKECTDTVREHGLTPLSYLDSIDFLDKKTLLVHAIWLSPRELDLIAQKGCSVSHNPISNMKLGSGRVAPVVQMLAKGINVGLGTDSVVSNNDLDMFEELKVTALLHKHHTANPKAMTYQKVLDMATIYGARALGLDDVGSIEPGKKADIITLRIESNLLPVNNVVSNIIYCANGNNVCDSIINGKIVMKNRKV